MKKTFKRNTIFCFVKENSIKIFTTLFTLLILFYAINVSLNRAAFIDFYAIDGDFQSYDAWRRLLHGYIPFRDFSVYLGLGHLYLGGLFTFIFGGNYYSSLIASTFLTIIFTAITMFIIVKLITNDINFSFFITSLFVIGETVFPNFINYFTHDICKVSYNYTTPAPSARIIRGFCIILYFVYVLFLVKKVYNTNFFKFTLFTSLMNGLLLMYSNDSGISGFLSASICFLILLICKFKRNILVILKYFCFWFFISFISWITVILVVSLGDIKSYFDVVFGTSGAQSWYFPVLTNAYIFSISDIFHYLNTGDYFVMFYILLEFVFVIRRKNEKNFWIHLGLLFIYLSFFVDRWAYAIVTSPRKGEWLGILFFASSAGYIYLLVKLLIKNKFIYPLLVVYLLAFIYFACTQINTALNVYQTYATRAEKGKYFKSLGGYLSNDGIMLYSGLPGVTSEGMDELQNIVKGKNFFSTYSSAIEVMNDKFSPVKEDYIIHALNKRQQNDYLNTFKKGNYEYLLTPSIKASVGSYEWIIADNWYFYSYVFQHYHYVGTYAYADVWKRDNKNRDINIKYSISTQIVNNGSIKNISVITVKTPKKISGIVNLKIKYNVSGQPLGTIHTNIGLVSILPENVTSKVDTPYYNLPHKGEYTVPVYLKNGSGSLLVYPYPPNKASLEIEKLEITNVFKYDYKNILRQEPYNSMIGSN